MLFFKLFFQESESDIWSDLVSVAKSIAEPIASQHVNGHWQDIISISDSAASQSTFLDDEYAREDAVEGNIYINSKYFTSNSLKQAIMAMKNVLNVKGAEIQKEEITTSGLRGLYKIAFYVPTRVKTPSIAYHVTPTTNLDNIMTHGITPVIEGGRRQQQQQQGWEQHGQGKIFLASSEEVARRWIYIFKDKRPSDVDWAILKIDMSKVANKIGYRDNSAGGVDYDAFYIKTLIPATAIVGKEILNFSSTQNGLVFQEDGGFEKKYYVIPILTVKGYKRYNTLYISDINYDRQEKKEYELEDTEKIIMPQLVRDICQTKVKSVYLGNKIHVPYTIRGIHDMNLFETLLAKCGIKVEYEESRRY